MFETEDRAPALKEDKLRAKRLMFRSGERPKWVIEKALKSLPDDAIIVDCISDFQSHSWGFIVRSKTFAPVGEGQMIPTIEISVNGPRKEVTSSKSIMDALKDL